MISAFLCPCHGLIRFGDDPDNDSTVIIKPGKNKDGYFDNEDLARQSKKMVRIFNELHPGCQALIAYDNSANHHAFAHGALIASRLNLGTGERTCS